MGPEGFDSDILANHLRLVPRKAIPGSSTKDRHQYLDESLVQALAAG